MWWKCWCVYRWNLINYRVVYCNVHCLVVYVGKTSECVEKSVDAKIVLMKCLSNYLFITNKLLRFFARFRLRYVNAYHKSSIKYFDFSGFVACGKTENMGGALFWWEFGWIFVTQNVMFYNNIHMKFVK